MDSIQAQQCTTKIAQDLNNLSDISSSIDSTGIVTSSSSMLTRIVGFVPSVLFRIAGFTTITIPLFFYRILTWSFTLHLNFSSLAMLIALIGLVGYYIIRYRFLTKYSRLKPVNPQKAASSFDLHPDSGEDSGYSKPNIKNYPDEFLSAFLSSIKIFGYLEQPVFHELARHLQTKKLLAGDTLFRNPEQERSFYIVVDGHVQMFVKPDNDNNNDNSDDTYSDKNSDDDHGATFTLSDSEDSGTRKKRRYDKFKDYTLINEVGQGGTLSSLFTILSIFRESFNRTELKEKTRHKSMRQQIASRSGQQQDSSSRQGSTSLPPPVLEMRRDTSSDEWRQVFPNLENQTSDPSLPVSSNSSVAAPDISPNTSRQHRLSSFGSMGNNGSHRINKNAYTPPMTAIHPQDDIIDTSLGAGFVNPQIHPRKAASQSTSFYRRQYRSVHPNIIARATVDTTLAVIPEEAFHKLTQKFPKAAAHIVQVIVTRFQRVTLMTSHRYLGLTTELLRLEKLTNDSVSEHGPFWNSPGDFFLPSAMDRLRKKFATENKDGDVTSPTTPTSTTGTSKGSGINSVAVNSNGRNSTSKDYPRNTPTTFSPRQLHYNSKVTGDDDYSMEDDEHLRTSVVKCLSKSLGIKTAPDSNSSTSNNKLPSLLYSHGSPREPRRNNYFDSPEQLRSRHVYPMDLFSQAGTVDSNPSPTLDALNYPYDDELDNLSTISSVHSGTDSHGGDRHQHHLSNFISPDEIMIMYYPEGAVLVREREHFGGLFFVIDGLLEATMTPTEGEEGNTPILQSNNEQSSIRPVRRKSNLTKRMSTSSGSKSKQKFSTISLFPSVDSNKHQQQLQNRQNEVVASEAPAGRLPSDKQKKFNKKQIKKPAFRIHPGGLAGYLDALTGHPSFVDIRAKQNTYVGYLPKKSLDRIVDRNPNVMMKLAKQLVDSLSPLLLHIDLSLEWMQVNAGQIICREGQPSESIYMVLHGRLRTIKEKKEGGLEILGEFGHGESVGELEVLTGTPTTSTLHAIRDSELARMPKTLFNALAQRHPEVTLQISRMVAYRSLQLVMNKSIPGQDKNVSFHLQNAISSGTASSSKEISSSAPNTELYGRNNVNLKTIGILPVNSMVPLTEFAANLKSALIHDVGASCILLNSATVTAVMGKHAFSRMGKLKIASWLAEQEEKARIVLYLADSGVNSQWTRTCIRQADCILLVGLGDEDPSVGEYERYMINMKTTARKELVLLHRERSCIPGSTQNWLKNRLWIQAHHHIFMAMKQHATLSTDRVRPPWLTTQGRKMTEGSINMLNNVKDQLEKYYSAVPTFGRLLVMNKKRGTTLTSVDTLSRNDFARLARRLCGRSVALVLGGGGARGISHIGVIQALEEAGIPIDIIGGTSIGSFVGGLYARDMDLVSTIARSKLFAGRVSSIWRQVMDLTYPVTAWFTGHEFNRAIWKCLGDSLVEDFWLPYFAVTTNITFSRMEVHTTGYAWRYIRASMSLSGYMPPICDNGNMLVDGGYMDNLPVTVAKNMGADIVIAVDVASDDDTSPVNYGDSISGWWAILHSYNPFRTYNIPSIAEIQSRLTYVSSVAKLEEAKLINGTLYVKLPVQQWGTLEFSKFNDIKNLGYQVGKTVVGRWLSAGYATGRLAEDDDQGRWLGKEVKGKRGRRNSV
ncbi:uncharacterized protein BX664DRAFT_260351 [Halteromyces radiatus]|uniref:uncharacterized protein n=1 Tax=Halteromyces radiatus TaxID=101107 RepID=UPI00221F34DA|nr:uncharacterized protein BX664DRAFT_260351 [Halteromyces radiatus]KAI8093035.1 hypothetical protein BX664DRAFT_260351 [Halteromyces radiatus]